MKRTLMVLLLVAAAVVAFAEGSTDKPPAKTVEIRWLVNGGTEVVEGNTLQKELEKKFNVKIVNVAEDIFNTEKMNILAASGNMPDAGFSYLNPVTMYQQEVIRTIPKAAIRKYAPGFAAMYDKNATAWLIMKAPDKTDEYLALEGINLSSDSDSFYSIYRLDWLEKVGIKPKGTLVDCGGGLYFSPSAFSLAEFEQILDAFTNKDPDGNGKKDTFGMSGMEYENYTFASLYQAFQLPLARSIDLTLEGGVEKPFVLSEKWKAFLKFAHGLYQKGYLDPEFAQLGWDKAAEKMTGGFVGWMTMPGSYAVPSFKDRPPMGILAKNPKAKVLITPPELGPDGKQHTTTWNPVTSVSYNFLIGKKVDDEKLARILQIVDYTSMNKDLSVRMRYFYGAEGVNWKWEGAPNKSAVVSLQSSATSKERGADGFKMYYHVAYDELMWPTFINSTYRPIYDWTVTTGRSSKYVPSTRYNLFSDQAINDWQKQYGSEVGTIMAEFYLKAIVGEVDIDQAWAGYVDSMNKAGLDKYVPLAKKLPLSSELIKGQVKY